MTFLVRLNVELRVAKRYCATLSEGKPLYRLRAPSSI